MGSRNKKTLAIKIILIGLLSAKSSFAKTLTLSWTSGKSKPCHELVLTFLKELKDHTNDDVIEFNEDTNSHSENNNPISLSCNANRAQVSELLFKKDDDQLIMHYLGKHAGYDSLDWLQFQKKFIADQTNPSVLSSKSISFTASENTSLLETQNTTQTLDSRKYLITALGASTGVLAGAYFSPNQESKVMNMAVFGALSGLASYLLSNQLFGE